MENTITIPVAEYIEILEYKLKFFYMAEIAKIDRDKLQAQIEALKKGDIPEQHSQAWVEGLNDEKKGKEIDANPWHITDKPQYSEWKKGWYVSRKHANMAKEKSEGYQQWVEENYNPPEGL